MSIINRIINLLEANGKKMSQLCEYLNINTSTMANWKTRNTDPPAKYIVGIAQFLNVSVEYILTGEECQKTTISNLKNSSVGVIGANSNSSITINSPSNHQEENDELSTEMLRLFNSLKISEKISLIQSLYDKTK